MIDGLIDFVLNNWFYIAVLAILAFFAIRIYRRWQRYHLWFKSFQYRLPLVGRINRLAKEDITSRQSGWFYPELELCSDFYNELGHISGDSQMYAKSRSYLKKVHELGRKELPWWGWILLFGLIIVEALGFAFILAEFMSPGSSAAIETMIAYGLSILLAVVLMIVTHQAGRELHRRRLIKMARTWWVNDKRGEHDKPFGAPDPKVDLENDQADDEQPQYQQMINRLDHDGLARPVKPIYTTVAAIFILAIFVGATFVRIQVWEGRTSDPIPEERMPSGSASSGSGNNSDVFEQGDNQPQLPKDPADKAQQRLNEVMSQIKAAETNAAYATYIMLGILFLVIQFISIGVGHKTGFAGTESQKAHEIIANISSQQEYENRVKLERERVIRMAQYLLNRLQRRLLQNAQHSGVSQDVLTRLDRSNERTFRDYLKETHATSDKAEGETKVVMH